MATNNPDQIIKVFNNTFAKALNGYDIEQFVSYDKYILNIFQNSSDEDSKIAINIGNSLSLSIILAMAEMNNSNYVDFINRTISLFKLNNSTKLDICFALFKTGKDMNSKVKFERWILFINNSKKSPHNELKEIFNKIYQTLKKCLTVRKAGEAGMRLNDEGLYFPPTDIMDDVMKLMDNIITECGGEILFIME